MIIEKCYRALFNYYDLKILLSIILINKSHNILVQKINDNARLLDFKSNKK